MALAFVFVFIVVTKGESALNIGTSLAESGERCEMEGSCESLDEKLALIQMRIAVSTPTAKPHKKGSESNKKDGKSNMKNSSLIQKKGEEDSQSTRSRRHRLTEDPIRGLCGNLHANAGSRGFAICMKPGEQRSVIALATQLSRVGNTDPIEVFLFKGELDRASRMGVVHELVGSLSQQICVRELKERMQNSTFAHFACKPYALLESSFEQVMQVDSDVVFYKNPDVLWSIPQVRRTGTMFFHDRYWKDKTSKTCTTLHAMAAHFQVTLASDLANRYPASCGAPDQMSGTEACTSVVLVNKRQRPDLLKYLRALHDNYFSTFYVDDDQNVGYADGETFWMACELASPGDCFFSPWRPTNVFKLGFSSRSFCSTQVDPGNPQDLLYTNFDEMCSHFHGSQVPMWMMVDSVDLLGNISTYNASDWICNLTIPFCPGPAGYRYLTAAEREAFQLLTMNANESYETWLFLSKPLIAHQRLQNNAYLFIAAALFGLLYHIVTTYVDGKSRFTIAVEASIWLACSAMMSVLNKLLVESSSTPFIILAVQMFVGDLLLLVACGRPLCWEIWRNKEAVGRWSIITVPVTGMMVTSLLVMETVSVSALIIIRGALPLPTLVLERMCLPESAPQITAEMIVSLLLVAFGIAMHIQNDFELTPMGLTWICMNMVCSIAARILERKLLLDASMTLSFEAMNLVNNTIGLLPTLGLLVLRKEHLNWHSQGLDGRRGAHVLIEPTILCSLVLSGGLGLALGWYGIVLQQKIAATSMVVLQLLARIATILLAVVMLAENLTLQMWIGCITSLVGCGWYGWIMKRVPVPKK